jgi:hypothetical protein
MVVATEIIRKTAPATSAKAAARRKTIAAKKATKKRKELMAKEATLKAWQLAYENRHRRLT